MAAVTRLGPGGYPVAAIGGPPHGIANGIGTASGPVQGVGVGEADGVGGATGISTLGGVGHADGVGGATGITTGGFPHSFGITI